MFSISSRHNNIGEKSYILSCIAHYSYENCKIYWVLLFLHTIPNDLFRGYDPGISGSTLIISLNDSPYNY